jgi:signal transduction histidine kinase
MPTPRLPRRTARLRLTLLFGAAFLICGAAVLAVVTYVLFRHGPDFGSSSNGGRAVATQVMNGQVPAAKVRRAGSFDVIPVRIPAADVHRVGGKDVFSVTTGRQLIRKQPPLTAAERAKLLAKANIKISYAEDNILLISSISLAVIAVAAAAIGWIIAGRVLRPLSTITAAARRIAASSLHERLALDGPDDELKELADTLDSLLARLEASFDAQRRFAANASHELRTPLTRERALLQVTLADPAATTATWQDVSRELLASNAEQERLIEALLTLASGEADPGQREPLDLAAVTSEALAVPRPARSRLGLEVRTDLEPASLLGDPLLIQQLVTNLIDNAVGHNIPGGDVQVSTSTRDGHAVLSVTNSGPVIPPAEVDRLFQPFQRLGSRPVRRDGGHGLGLSIVRAIAKAHGAAVTARPRPGGGLAIEVSFVSPAPAASQERPGEPVSLRWPV